MVLASVVGSSQLRRRYSLLYPNTPGFCLDDSTLSEKDVVEISGRVLKYLIPGYELCSVPDLQDEGEQTEIVGEDIVEDEFSHVSVKTEEDENSDEERFLSVHDSHSRSYPKQSLSYSPYSILLNLHPSPTLIVYDGERETTIDIPEEEIKVETLQVTISSSTQPNFQVNLGGKVLYPVREESIDEKEKEEPISVKRESRPLHDLISKTMKCFDQGDEVTEKSWSRLRKSSEMRMKEVRNKSLDSQISSIPSLPNMFTHSSKILMEEGLMPKMSLYEREVSERNLMANRKFERNLSILKEENKRRMILKTDEEIIEDKIRENGRPISAKENNLEKKLIKEFSKQNVPSTSYEIKNKKYEKEMKADLLKRSKMEASHSNINEEDNLVEILKCTEIIPDDNINKKKIDVIIIPKSAVKIKENSNIKEQPVNIIKVPKSFLPNFGELKVENRSMEIIIVPDKIIKDIKISKRINNLKEIKEIKNININKFEIIKVPRNLISNLFNLTEEEEEENNSKIQQEDLKSTTKNILPKIDENIKCDKKKCTTSKEEKEIDIRATVELIGKDMKEGKIVSTILPKSLASHIINSKETEILGPEIIINEIKEATIQFIKVPKSFIKDIIKKNITDLDKMTEKTETVEFIKIPDYYISDNEEKGRFIITNNDLEKAKLTENNVNEKGSEEKEIVTNSKMEETHIEKKHPPIELNKVEKSSTSNEVFIETDEVFKAAAVNVATKFPYATTSEEASIDSILKEIGLDNKAKLLDPSYIDKDDNIIKYNKKHIEDKTKVFMIPKKIVKNEKQTQMIFVLPNTMNSVTDQSEEESMSEGNLSYLKEENISNKDKISRIKTINLKPNMSIKSDDSTFKVSELYTEKDKKKSRIDYQEAETKSTIMDKSENVSLLSSSVELLFLGNIKDYFNIEGVQKTSEDNIESTKTQKEVVKPKAKKISNENSIVKKDINYRSNRNSGPTSNQINRSSIKQNTKIEIDRKLDVMQNGKLETRPTEENFKALSYQDNDLKDILKGFINEKKSEQFPSKFNKFEENRVNGGEESVELYDESLTHIIFKLPQGKKIPEKLIFLSHTTEEETSSEVNSVDGNLHRHGNDIQKYVETTISREQCKDSDLKLEASESKISILELKNNKIENELEDMIILGILKRSLKTDDKTDLVMETSDTISSSITGDSKEREDTDEMTHKIIILGLIKDSDEGTDKPRDPKLSSDEIISALTEDSNKREYKKGEIIGTSDTVTSALTEDSNKWEDNSDEIIEISDTIASGPTNYNKGENKIDVLLDTPDLTSAQAVREVDQSGINNSSRVWSPQDIIEDVNKEMKQIIDEINKLHEDFLGLDLTELDEKVIRQIEEEKQKPSPSPEPNKIQHNNRLPPFYPVPVLQPIPGTSTSHNEFREPHQVKVPLSQTFQPSFSKSLDPMRIASLPPPPESLAEFYRSIGYEPKYLKSDSTLCHCEKGQCLGLDRPENIVCRLININFRTPLPEIYQEISYHPSYRRTENYKPPSSLLTDPEAFFENKTPKENSTENKSIPNKKK